MKLLVTGTEGYIGARLGPILTAHGKSLFPAKLTGRGITLMNIGAIGGAFLSQSVTGVLMDAVGRSSAGIYLPEGYRLVFAALA